MSRLLLAFSAVTALISAMLGGFYLGSARKSDPPPASPPVPTSAVAAETAPGALAERVEELEQALIQADRENATLKRTVAAAQAEQARAEQARATVEADLADRTRQQDRLREDLARLRRALDQRPEVSPEVPPRPASANPEPPAEPLPPPILVRLLSLDETTQVVAIDRGADKGLQAGDRHLLEDVNGARAFIEWTEVRPAFAVGRRLPHDPAGRTSLELVSGKQYALIPPP